MNMIMESTHESAVGWQIGYARVSTEDQSLDMQIAALIKAGVDPKNIYSETVSGVSSKRYQLE